MATLELKPNVAVVVVQAAIFFANIYVVKKLMLEPYLRLRKMRFDVTDGRYREAKKIFEQSETAMQEIRGRLQDAAMNAKTEREAVMKRAGAERQGILGRAEENAKGIVASIRSQITADLERERAQLGQQIDALTKQFMQEIVR